jgi:glycerophosphoryl diester phosphodiesterase
MIPALPTRFLTLPLAHRGLHDIGAGRPENSRAAVRAAVENGYGIEIDVQLTADGHAVVFHDDTLDRLTRATGPVAARKAAELARIDLRHGSEGIPTLDEVLECVAGRVPLLVEIKDQDGALGPDVGALESAVASALDAYDGDVAVMSFNPHSVSAMQALSPTIPRGLTTEDFTASPDWPVPEPRLAELAEIPDYDRVGASFISHNRNHLAQPRVRELKDDGAAILCWTVRTREQEENARRIADNITFEGYLPERRA